ANEALLDSVATVRQAGLALKSFQIMLAIVGMGDIEDGQREQLLACIAGNRAGCFVDPQQPAFRIDFRYRDPRVLVGREEPLLSFSKLVQDPLGFRDVLECARAIEEGAGGFAPGGSDARLPGERSW